MWHVEEVICSQIARSIINRIWAGTKAPFGKLPISIFSLKCTSILGVQCYTDSISYDRSHPPSKIVLAWGKNKKAGLELCPTLVMDFLNFSVAVLLLATKTSLTDGPALVWRERKIVYNSRSERNCSKAELFAWHASKPCGTRRNGSNTWNQCSNTASCACTIHVQHKLSTAKLSASSTCLTVSQRFSVDGVQWSIKWLLKTKMVVLMIIEVYKYSLISRDYLFKCLHYHFFLDLLHLELQPAIPVLLHRNTTA